MIVFLIILYCYLALVIYYRISGKNIKVVQIINLSLSAITLPFFISLILISIWPDGPGILGGLASLSGLYFGFPLGIIASIVTLVYGIRRLKSRPRIHWFFNYFIPMQGSAIFLYIIFKS